MTTESQFIDTMLDDIAKNRLEFPTLPEVALRVRKLIEDPNVTSSKVAQVISTDPALTSRLLQVANSAMFAGMPQLDNLKAAVNRLGLAIVRNMVTCVVMKTLYQPKLPQNIRARMQALWQHSTKVAAFSHALSKHYINIRPDEAMLAGLIHDIGTLPILTRCVQFPDLVQNPKALQQVIDRLHCEIGKLILEAWHFPEPLIKVAAEHEDLLRMSTGDPEYVDIVTVANLHAHLGDDHPLAKADWSTVPTFAKLNLTPEQSIQAIKEAQGEIAAVYQLLGGKG